MHVTEIKVPDIGDYKGVPVIEVLVAPGDVVREEQSLVTLESDKATMDVPSPFGGVVREIKLRVGEAVSEGSVILLMEPHGAVAEVVTSEAASRANSWLHDRMPVACEQCFYSTGTRRHATTWGQNWQQVGSKR